MSQTVLHFDENRKDVPNVVFQVVVNSTSKIIKGITVE